MVIETFDGFDIRYVLDGSAVAISQHIPEPAPKGEFRYYIILARQRAERDTYVDNQAAAGFRAWITSPVPEAPACATTNAFTVPKHVASRAIEWFDKLMVVLASEDEVRRQNNIRAKAYRKHRQAKKAAQLLSVSLGHDMEVQRLGASGIQITANTSDGVVFLCLDEDAISKLKAFLKTWKPTEATD